MSNTDYVPLTLKYLCMYNVQKVLPAVYDDSLSYYEVLAKVQCKVNEMVGDLNQLNEWQQAQDEVMALLEQKVDDFIAGGYKEDFYEYAQAWLTDNIEQALARATRYVFFGLTEDGYFCAYVPAMWAFVFDTDVNYDSENYGRLEIIY